MLNDLNPAFRILASSSPADAQATAALITHLGAIPREYVQLVSEATEIEMWHESGQYIRIWNPAGCIEMDEGYRIRQRIPGAIPIGDDGASGLLFYFDGKQGFGLYRVGYGNLDGDDAIWFAPTLTDFLTNGTGIETFYGSPKDSM